MASSISVLSEEQFLCPICLDMFTQPVSTPCGHNFCMSCITCYWQTSLVCQCPVCKEKFERRPHLKVNTFISELASQFTLLQVTDAQVCSWEQRMENSSGVVLCDICTDTQQEAVRSCLECLTSYCDVHLEPHRRAAGLKRHTLVEPLADLEARMCKEHNRLLRMFCRKDKVLLCDVCSSLRHLNHNVVPVQQAYKEMKDALEDTDAKAQQMIQERQEKVQAMRRSVQQSKRDTEAVIAQSTEDLAVLVAEIQKSQAELVKVMEEKQNTAEEQVDGFIRCMERDVSHLQAARRKLRELEQRKDQLGFLQEFPKCVLPQTTDLSSLSFQRHVRMHHIHMCLSSSVSQLQVLLNNINTQMKKFCGSEDASDGATLMYMQQHEVNVVLDPCTAHPMLVVSENRKEVRYNVGSGLWANQNLSPNTFTEHLAVLGAHGFASCRFYFEVFVGGKNEWCLGVAKASVQRRGGFARSPHCGLWALWFLVDRMETFSCPDVPVHWGKVERVGVFVDYDGGQVSFYDVQTGKLIYSFTECFFTEVLHPYFNPCDNEYGSNLDPMVIVPVVRMNLS